MATLASTKLLITLKSVENNPFPKSFFISMRRGGGGQWSTLDLREITLKMAMIVNKDLNIIVVMKTRMTTFITINKARIILNMNEYIL